MQMTVVSALHTSHCLRAPRNSQRSQTRCVAATAPAILLLPTLRHDRAAHRGGAEGDDERGEQQYEPDARGAISEDQLAQMSGVQPKQSADEERGCAGANREVDGEQAQKRNAQEAEGGQPFSPSDVWHEDSPQA